MSDEAIAEQLGDALRTRRLRKDITQDELANLVGVSTPTIQKLEKGRGTLQLLIAVLRELNSLDLLSSLTAPPRVSPLAVAKSGKAVRLRAVGTIRNQLVGKRTLDVKATKQGEKPLLIPRK
ncbi:helix-turn-helix transcriptional regulator [Pseudomonas guariconensis]|uniref:helix-turn-helix transcriptional regulator n=1 Tax=Pseudomonas guariconensis TaxID=1288410 RepID=UPI00346516BF